MKNTPKTPEPMDDSAVTHAIGTPAVNNKRPCWAAQTMVEEFTELFPETNHEFTGFNGRNAALEVLFDLSMLDFGDLETAQDLLTCSRVDPRVAHVMQQGDQAVVAFKNLPLSYDLRQPFGFGEALGVLDGSPDDE